MILSKVQFYDIFVKLDFRTNTSGEGRKPEGSNEILMIKRRVKKLWTTFHEMGVYDFF